VRRGPAVAAVALAVLLVPQPAPPQTPGPTPNGGSAGIQRLLDRRAVAMLAGDEAAFLSTIDGDGDFVARQRLLFRGFQQLGLAGYSLEAATHTFPELTAAREVARYGAAAEPTVLHVEERYVIDGYDEQPALEDLFLTFVRRPGGWRIASDTDLDDVGLLSGRKLWELGPVVTSVSDHFLYVSHPALAERAGDVLAGAERALARVVDGWPLSWPQRVVIFAPSDTAELGRIIQATFDLDAFVAFAYSGVDRGVDYDLVGHRIILNWPRYSAYPESVRESILAHELTHVATRELTGPEIPVFVDEGIADWVAGDDSTFLVESLVAGGSFDSRLPDDYEFVTGDSEAIGAAYQESRVAIEYAEERYGAAAVADLYRILGGVRVAPGTWRYHADLAMHRAFGTGLVRFERGWASWVRATYG